MKLIFIIISITFLSCNFFTNSKPLPKQSLPFKKFTDSLNTTVFTSKFVVIDKKDITIIRHETEDGAWIFFSNDEYNDYEKVSKVIGLG